MAGATNLRGIAAAAARHLACGGGGGLWRALWRDAERQLLGGGRAPSDCALRAARRNLRRRLYDALKVLRALRAAGVTLPRTRACALPSARMRVRAKRVLAARLKRRVAAAMRLAERNGGSEMIEMETRVPERRLSLPFVLLRARKDADLALRTSADGSHIALRVARPFQLVNDAALLDRLFTVPPGGAE